MLCCSWILWVLTLTLSVATHWSPCNTFLMLKLNTRIENTNSLSWALGFCLILKLDRSFISRCLLLCSVQVNSTSLMLMWKEAMKALCMYICPLSLFSSVILGGDPWWMFVCFLIIRCLHHMCAKTHLNNSVLVWLSADFLQINQQCQNCRLWSRYTVSDHWSRDYSLTVKESLRPLQKHFKINPNTCSVRHPAAYCVRVIEWLSLNSLCAPWDSTVHNVLFSFHAMNAIISQQHLNTVRWFSFSFTGFSLIIP